MESSPTMKIWVSANLFILLVISMQAAVDAVEYTGDGLEIQWAYTCIDLTYIECPYTYEVEVLTLTLGTKGDDCITTGAECCAFNETDCHRAGSNPSLAIQQAECANKTKCLFYLPLGSNLGCGFSKYAAVSFVCFNADITTTSTTQVTTTVTEESTTPLLKPVKKDIEINLYAAIGAPIAIIFILVVVTLCIIYARFYRGKRNLQSVKGPPPVTYLGMKIDGTHARVKTGPRFKVGTGGKKLGSLFKYQPGVSRISNRSSIYHRMSEHRPGMPVSYSYAHTGNLWKQANWMTTLNTSQRLYKKKDKDRLSKARLLQASMDRDLDSLKMDDDLDSFPDISIFSVPYGRGSPDSGLDNVAFISPTIPERSAHSGTPEQRVVRGRLEQMFTPINDKQYTEHNDGVLLQVPQPISDRDVQAEFDHVRYRDGVYEDNRNSRHGYDSGIVPDHGRGVQRNMDPGGFYPESTQSSRDSQDRGGAFSSVSSTIATEILY